MNYTFKNQYGTNLHTGWHESDTEAWEAFFYTCEYPSYAKDIAQAMKDGIYFTKN